MLIDTRSIETQPEGPYDVCIIGAGAAGIPMALELGRWRNRQIALIDTGGLRRHRSTQNDFRGEILGDRHPPLHRARYAGLGGSTELWAGWSRPLDALDFESRDWVNHSGWPISLGDLQEEYRRANQWCGLSDSGYELGQWSSLFEGESLAMAENLQDQVFQVRRLKFSDAYRDDLEKSQNVSVFLYTTALRFRCGDGSLAESLWVALGDGRTLEMKAKRYVVAVGGLENPRLLLLSGESPERALGNWNGLVGHYFTEHGFIDSGWLRTTRPRNLKRYFPLPILDGRTQGCARHVLTLSDQIKEEERLNNAAVFFYPGYEASSAFDSEAVKAALELWEIAKGQAVPGEWGRLFGRALLGPHHIAVAAFRKALVKESARRDWRLRCYYECEPDPNNRLELTRDKDRFGRERGRLIWRLGEEDLRRARRFHEILDEKLVNENIGHIEYLDTIDKWREKTESGKHPMGTTRMHESPSKGVVDSNCKIHGVDNVYVVGSSVFPATGYANPTLTIVALALRVSDHLSTLA